MIFLDPEVPEFRAQHLDESLLVSELDSVTALLWALRSG
jgi:hypothetical protein